MMWLPGHVAFAVVVCSPVLLIGVRRGTAFVPGLAAVFFFSVMPDFFHIGDVRMISHSIAGLVLVGLVALAILRFARLGWTILILAAIAMSTHLVGDLFIGHIYPYFPFSAATASLNQFNTSFDLRVELALSLAALLIIAVLAAMSKARPRTRKASTPILLRLAGYATASMAVAELGLFLWTDLGNRRLGTAPYLAPMFLMPVGLLVFLEIDAWKSALTKWRQ